MELTASTTDEVANSEDHEKLIHPQTEGEGDEERRKKLQMYYHRHQADDDDMGTTSCKLCLCDDFEANELMKLLACKCVFCIECMKMYVETLIDDRQQVVIITCPDSSCKLNGLLSPNEIKRLLDNDEKYSKFEKLKFEQEVAVDPSRTFCPKSSCSAVCEINVDENMIRTSTSLGPFPVSCSSCNHQFCYFCQTEWQPLHECPPSVFESGAVSSEFHKLRAKFGLINGGIGGNDRTATIKRCPFCGIPIERNRGCAQMICKNCSHVFCWYCLKLLDNDFMLRHYDKGPCRNMLGHSRAQVLRHRLGIIGLFVAFYLLVVISSPILLLAAPIILCCKFKECCKKRHRQLVQRRSHHHGHKQEEEEDVESAASSTPHAQQYTTTNVEHITETSTKQQQQVVAVHTCDHKSSTPPSSGDHNSPTPSSGDKSPPSSGDNSSTPSSGDKSPPSSGDKSPPSSGDKPPPSSGDKSPPSSSDKPSTPSSGNNSPPPSSGGKMNTEGGIITQLLSSDDPNQVYLEMQKQENTKTTTSTTTKQQQVGDESV